MERFIEVRIVRKTPGKAPKDQQGREKVRWPDCAKAAERHCCKPRRPVLHLVGEYTMAGVLDLPRTYRSRGMGMRSLRVQAETLLAHRMNTDKTEGFPFLCRPSVFIRG